MSFFSLCWAACRLQNKLKFHIPTFWILPLGLGCFIWFLLMLLNTAFHTFTYVFHCSLTRSLSKLSKGLEEFMCISLTTRCASAITSFLSDSLRSQDCSPSGSSLYGNCAGKNSAVGFPALFQTIFLTQGSMAHLLCLLHCRLILYHWATEYMGCLSVEERSDSLVLSFCVHSVHPHIEQTRAPEQCLWHTLWPISMSFPPAIDLWLYSRNRAWLSARS